MHKLIDISKVKQKNRWNGICN